MNCRFVKLNCWLAIVLLAMTGIAHGQQVDYMRAKHLSVLQGWLGGRPALQLATEEYCRNKEGLIATRQENGQSYQPYYAVGDFNRDGQEDFAVALVNQSKRSRKFAIAIFNGPFNARKPSVPAFFKEGIDLSDGGLVVLTGNRLVAGVFQSDDCVVLRPSGRTYLMKSCV